MSQRHGCTTLLDWNEPGPRLWADNPHAFSFVTYPSYIQMPSVANFDTDITGEMFNISQMAGRSLMIARALDRFSMLRSNPSCRCGHSQLRYSVRADKRVLLRATMPQQQFTSRRSIATSSEATPMASRITDVAAPPQPHANGSSQDTGDEGAPEGEEEEEDSAFSTLILAVTMSMPFLAVQASQRRAAGGTIEHDAPRIRPRPEHGGHRLPIRARCSWDCTSGRPTYTRIVDEAWDRDIELWNTSTDLRRGADLMAKFHFRTSPMANSHLPKSVDVGSGCLD